LTDASDTNVIELTKKVGDKKVTVSFMSRSPDLGEEEEEEG